MLAQLLPFEFETNYMIPLQPKHFLPVIVRYLEGPFFHAQNQLFSVICQHTIVMCMFNLLRLLWGNFPVEFLGKTETLVFLMMRNVN